MSKRKQPDRKTSPDGSKVHVYLLVPVVLHEWLEDGTRSAGFKNVQDKILDVLRTAREAEQQQEQAA